MSAPAVHNRVFSLMGWGGAICLSLGLNLFLFGIMPDLIRTIPEQPEDLDNVRAIQVVRVKRPKTPPKKKEDVKPPKPMETPTPVLQPAKMSAPKPDRIKPRLPFELTSSLPTISSSLEMPPLSNFSMKAPIPKGLYMSSELDGPLTAMAKVPPVYPMRAARLGLEGWVKIGFVVTREGLVENIKILEADPEGVFENAVVNCVSQWRFRPGTVVGVAVPAQARTTIRFQLEQ